MKIQEQPVPIQELIPRRGPSPLVHGRGHRAAAVLVVIIVLAGAWAIAAGEQSRVLEATPVEYRVEGTTFEKRVYVGDSLLVSYGNEKYKLLVSRIDDAVTLETPVGASRLMLGEEGTIDLDRNNQPEIKVLVSDLAKKDPSKGALIKLEYTSSDAALKAAAQAPNAPPAAQTGDTETQDQGAAQGAAQSAPQAASAPAPAAWAPASRRPRASRSSSSNRARPRIPSSSR